MKEMGLFGMAKLYASEVALEPSLDCMRIHGGYGYSTEFDAELLAAMPH
jgi:alkylation response protein AidB-like acyl-CoA dehydrogenase